MVRLSWAGIVGTVAAAACLPYHTALLTAELVSLISFSPSDPQEWKNCHCDSGPRNLEKSEEDSWSNDAWKNDEQDCQHELHHPDPSQPVGQHLLIDIRNVDPNFLAHTELLAKATIAAFSLADLTMLSYECSDLMAPASVSCVGVSSESQLLLHTWPQTGVIFLDLFTCGTRSLLPMISLLEEVFAVPSAAGSDSPFLSWSHKKRGYNDYYDGEGNMAPEQTPVALQDDAERYLNGWTAHKEKRFLLSEDTSFQNVEVFEYGENAFQRPNKRVFLDGILQSTLNGLEAYHESLVHPALFAHPNPRRVAIIGGGEGATLREVLKFDSVETVAMIEIDQAFVGLAREHLSEWNDCSDLLWNHKSCFDDPRAELHYDSAVSWFINRYGINAIDDSDKFDVIIMDALDPSSEVEFSDVLYGDEEFIASLVNGLADNGMLVVQIGQCARGKESGAKTMRDREVLTRYEHLLMGNGMSGMKAYDEGHSQFFEPWQFRIVHKDKPGTESGDIVNFFQEPAFVNMRLAKRTVKTRSMQLPFQYFDGPTLASIQYPSRLEEEAFCSRFDSNEPCNRSRGVNPDHDNIPRRPKLGSYTALEESTHSIVFMPQVRSTIRAMTNSEAGGIVSMFNDLLSVVKWHGDALHHVNVEAVTFINNGSSTEQAAGSDRLLHKDTFYNPFLDRNQIIFQSTAELWMGVVKGQEAPSYVEAREHWASRHCIQNQSTHIHPNQTQSNRHDKSILGGFVDALAGLSTN